MRYLYIISLFLIATSLFAGKGSSMQCMGKFHNYLTPASQEYAQKTQGMSDDNQKMVHFKKFYGECLRLMETSCSWFCDQMLLDKMPADKKAELKAYANSLGSTSETEKKELYEKTEKSHPTLKNLRNGNEALKNGGDVYDYINALKKK